MQMFGVCFFRQTKPGFTNYLSQIFIFESMKFFGQPLSNPFTRDNTSLKSPASWFLKLWGGSKSNVSVTEDNAVRMSAVWACVNIISETVAQLPWSIYERTETGRVQRQNDPRFFLLHHNPNDIMTSFNFRFALMANVLTRGNGWAIIERGRDGKPTSFVFVPTKHVTVHKRDNSVFVEIDGHSEWYDYDDMIHIQGFTTDGVIGKSPIQIHRENIGLGIAATDFGAEFFGNGAALGGILKTNKILDPTKKDEIKSEWSKEYGNGSGNSNKTAVLDADMDYKPISIPPNDAQFIETRRFQVEEIARIFNVPPHMIGHMEKSSFNNIEQQSLEYVKYTIGPWVRRIEQEFDRKMFVGSERQTYFNKINVNGLLRGDVKSRAQFYKDLFFIGALNPNEIRAWEDMNDRIDGDLYFTPVNMIDNESLDAQIEDNKNQNNE